MLIAQATAEGSNLVDLLSNASGPVMLAIIIVAAVTGKIRMPREVESLERQLAEKDAAHAKTLQGVEEQRDEFKRIAFGALRIGEKVVTVTEDYRV